MINFDEKKIRILIIGEKGSGKSSIIEMIAKNNEISLSKINNEIFPYKIISSDKFEFIETVGITSKSMNPEYANQMISSISNFISHITNGISLIILVMKCGRINDLLEKNYNLFNDIFNNELSVVLVVTYCESIVNMNSWWDSNREHFEKYKMSFELVLCICGSMGDSIEPLMQQVQKRKYNESQVALDNLIKMHISSSFKIFELKSSKYLLISKVLQFYIDHVELYKNFGIANSNDTESELFQENQLRLIRLPISTKQIENGDIKNNKLNRWWVTRKFSIICSTFNYELAKIITKENKILMVLPIWISLYKNGNWKIYDDSIILDYYENIHDFIIINATSLISSFLNDCIYFQFLDLKFKM